MTLILPRPNGKYTTITQERVHQALEQADAQNLKRTGDIDFPHSLNVQGELSVTEGQITAGTYTPTLTEVANLDASTAYACQYMRVGNVVTVSGAVDVDPTTTSTTTKLGISLPVASNFALSINCGGVGHAVLFAEGAAIYADGTNDRAEMQWLAGDVTDHAVFFTFTYQVI